MEYAVGFARPDRWVQSSGADEARPWHAVEAIRSPEELDGEVELAVCGAIVQVWGRQEWDRLAAGRTACPECLRLTSLPSAAPPACPVSAARPAARPAEGRHLRVVG